MTDKDKILVERIKNSDDHKAFEYLYHLYYPLLCNYAYGFVRRTAESEDIVNDCFCEFWINRKTIDIRHSVKAWLFVSVRNRCVNIMKKELVTQRYLTLNSYPLFMQEDIADQTEKLLQQEDLEVKLKSAIEELPGQCRYIFFLNRFEGMKYKDIARKLNLSEATVKTQIGRALKSLRNKLTGMHTILLLLFSKK